MAELYKFKDRTKSVEDRVKPIDAQELDDNLKTVRTELDTLLKTIFDIEQNKAVADKLKLKAGYPTSGTWVLGISAGVLLWIQTESC